MIVQRRHVLEVALVVAEVETHVEEQLSGLLVFLHFRRWQTINQPIDSIVFSYAVVDELPVFWRNLLCAQHFACCVVLQHVNLHRAIVASHGIDSANISILQRSEFYETLDLVNGLKRI